MKPIKNRLLAGVQKLLFGLAVVASLLLVLGVAAPWLAVHALQPLQGWLSSLPEVEANIVFYLVLHVFVIIGLLLFVRFFNAKLHDLGVGKMRYWYLLLLTPLIWLVYMMLTLGISLLLTIIFPEFNSGEKQDIGLSPEASPNLLLTALFLCIIVPLAEEFIFRGYLFGLLRKKFSFITVAIVVSLVFAALHLSIDTATGELVVKQLNVAVDVFTLSLFISYLRERTESIWAGVALHGLKNFVAFLYIFVYNVG